MNTKIEMPENVCRIIKILNDSGYEAYAVGGCVRDTLLDRVPGDWDITTSAKPQEVKSLFRRTIDTGIQHGTVTIMIGKEGYEVTTYRIDGAYEDGRHPKEVTFTGNLIEDLKRRDFTINAMAYNDTTGIVDAFDGLEDLRRGLIRAVGNPIDRFNEDALRILRALRFSAQLNYTVEEETLSAIGKLKDNLLLISAERIRTELEKLLVSDHPEVIRQLYLLGISKIILPELDELADGKRTEIIEALKRAVILKANLTDSEIKSVRLAILLSELTSEKAEAVLRRLKYDNDTIKKVSVLVGCESIPDESSEYIYRRIAVRVGRDIMPLLFPAKRALGRESEKKIAELEEGYAMILKRGDCLSIKEMSVTGADLINECGMKPGKEMGQVLEMLFEEVLLDPTKNDRDRLLERVKNYLAQKD